MPVEIAYLYFIAIAFTLHEIKQCPSCPVFLGHLVYEFAIQTYLVPIWERIPELRQ